MIGILATSTVFGYTLNAVNQVHATSWQGILSILAAVFSALLVIVAWIAYMENNRPYITLYTEIRKGSTINLILKNTGNRAAYNVRIVIDPPMESVYYAQHPERKMPFVTEKIHSFIGPDQTVSGEFDSLSWRYDRRSKDYVEPCDKYRVKIKYKHKIRRFTEKYKLDLSYLEFVPWSHSRDHLGDISNTLRKIADHQPRGFMYQLETGLRNGKIHLKKDGDGHTAVSSIKAEDAGNEPK